MVWESDNSSLKANGKLSPLEESVDSLSSEFSVSGEQGPHPVFINTINRMLNAPGGHINQCLKVLQAADLELVISKT